MLRDSSRITAPPAKRFCETTLAPRLSCKPSALPSCRLLPDNPPEYAGGLSGEFFVVYWIFVFLNNVCFRGCLERVLSASLFLFEKGGRAFALGGKLRDHPQNSKR